MRLELAVDQFVSRCGLTPGTRRCTPPPLLCASSMPSSPASPYDANGRLTKEAKVRLSQLLKQLPDNHEPSAEGCTSCLELMQQLRAEGLMRHVGANVHNHAMRLCAGQLEDVERLFAEVAEMRSLSEASYAMLMQAQVEHGEIDRARAVLDAMLVDPRVPKPRLRTCAPLLRKLCEMDEAEASVDMWGRLARRGVEFTTHEYAVRMRMHGRTGDARALHVSLSALLERHPAPDADSIEAIREAVSCLVAARPSPPGAPPECIVSLHRATLDADGACDSCGSAVRLLGLDAPERRQVRDTLLQRAGARSATGYEHLREYVEWLRVRPPFDYVLDGPNIAYFNQNWEQGAFSFRQIQDVIDAIKETNPMARVLLLLPTKYLQPEIPNHTSSRRKRTTLTEADWSLIGGWRSSGLLYECSPELYDDWYWMYASVAETQADEPSTAFVPREGVARVVTNDAMRDHWDQLLPSIAFRRWRHSQILPFGCHSSTELVAAVGADVEDVGASTAGGAAEEAPGAAPGAPQVEAAEETSSEPAVEVAAAAAVCVVETEAARADATTTAAQADFRHRGMERMRAVGIDGPLRTWVAPVPQLSVEAQAEGSRWHVPVPDTSPQEWLCISLPIEPDSNDMGRN